MDIEIVRAYCLSLPSVTEDFPFDETTLAFRIGNKIFALMSLDAEPLSINLKCSPDRAIELRETYSSIIPGFHMNKKHWNTVYIDGSLDEKLVQNLIQHSYELVLNSLPKILRQTIPPII